MSHVTGPLGTPEPELSRATPPRSHGCHPERTLVLWLVTWDRALALDTLALLGSQINAHGVSFLTSSDFQIKYDLIYLFIYVFF